MKKQNYTAKEWVVLYGIHLRSLAPRHLFTLFSLILYELNDHSTVLLLTLQTILIDKYFVNVVTVNTLLECSCVTAMPAQLQAISVHAMHHEDPEGQVPTAPIHSALACSLRSQQTVTSAEAQCNDEPRSAAFMFSRFTNAEHCRRGSRNDQRISFMQNLPQLRALLQCDGNQPCEESVGAVYVTSARLHTSR